MRYAGFWARFAAALIDGFVIGLLFLPAIIAVQAGPTELSECTVDDQGNVTFGDGAQAICEGPTGATLAAAGLLGLVALAGALLYVAKTEGGPSGQTLGKRALGIRVVDAVTGGPIGGGRAVGRYLFKSIISGSICALGYLWAIWDPRKQSWHDKVVISVVVKV
jgi:uncharacterized RDD family membrane protein YckC